MSRSRNGKVLRELTNELLADALAGIRALRDNAVAEKYCRTAEYLLTEAKQYVDGAWEMLASGRPDASIALSRWLLEASMDLCWAVSGEDKTDGRLRDLVGEALRHEANLLEGKAKLWPLRASAFEGMAKEVRKRREELGVREKLAPLDSRLQDTRKKECCDLTQLYQLYRICCEKAHPSLKAWKMFTVANGVTVPREPIDDSPMARWMVVASVFYLVSSCYCLTGCGNKEELNAWWEKQVRPLLKD